MWNSRVDDDLRRKSDEYERELAQPENELPAWRMRGKAEREVLTRASRLRGMTEEVPRRHSP